VGENAKFEALCEHVQETMESKGVPGVAVGVLHTGETFIAGFGVTNVDHPLDVTENTLFQIGSITKTFTCTAVMRLVEMNELDLDATVRTYIPEFRVADEDASAGVTVRHLLTHMEGWAGDFFHDTGAGDDALARYVADMGDLEQIAPLGAVWSYNNSGFSVAGRLIEVVTDKSYEEALKEVVLGPLGLERCFFGADDVITHRFAVGHRGEGGSAAVARPWPLPRYAHAMGGIVCPVGELLRYARFHMGDGRAEDGAEVLKPASLAAMQSPQAKIWGDEECIGLSWFVREIDGTRTVSHGGGTVGQSTLLVMVPERQFALAVFTNADGGDALNEDVRRWAIKEYLGLEEEKPKPIESTEEDLAQYAGLYTRPFADIELGMIGGRLIGVMTYKKGFPSESVPPRPPPPPASLGRCEEDRLLALDGPMKDARGDVIRKPDGTIGWLRLGRIYRRVE
jgi:CubicO group peptidase (beta-lactamase class C family)